MKYMLFLLMAGIIWTSCGETQEPVLFDSTLDLPTEYSYKVIITCYCLPTYVGPHFLRIRENEILEYELLTEAEGTETPDISTLTIDALETRTQSILAQKPFTQELIQHPDFNFATKAYFDIEQMIADEEWGYEITEFKVIEE